MARNVQMKNQSSPGRRFDENGMTQREWKRLNEKDQKAKNYTMRLIIVLVLLTALALAMGILVYQILLKSHDYTLTQAYDRNHSILGIPESIERSGRSVGFASNLCVTDRDIDPQAVSMTAYSAGLFDLENKQIILSRDMFSMRSPASLTKIMTTLVALKYGNPDDLVTVTETALKVEYGSSVCDIKVGDRLSLKQLLYGMIIASGNDAAMMIAEHVGGNVDEFIYMMNEEAKALGATRTYFENAHGLTSQNHYTCVYDLYLIFNEAMKYDLFMDMISRSNYYAEYTREDGSAVAVTWESTNHYFTGQAALPDNVIVYGGKTGTTEDAGACLALLCKDFYGNPYLAIILHAEDKDILYDDMTALLSLVPTEK